MSERILNPTQHGTPDEWQSSSEALDRALADQSGYELAEADDQDLAAGRATTDVGARYEPQRIAISKHTPSA